MSQLLLAEVALATGAVLVIPYLLYYIHIRRYSNQFASRPHTRERKVRVSLVVCTLNAAEFIGAKLDDILHQDYPLEYLRLIVVDGGSTDGTVEILARMRDKLFSKLNITIVGVGKEFRSKAAQINEGFRAAIDDIVVTTDADVTTHPIAIEALVDALSVDGVGAVCGREVMVNPHQSIATESEATYRGFYETLRLGESNMHSTPILNGLSGYRRQATSSIAEDVNADDTQLALSVIRNGFRAIYEPRSTFYVEAAPRLCENWFQRVRRGQGIQRVLWRNLDMILDRRFRAFSFPILAMEFYMHAISPILFAVTAVCLGLLLVLLTSQFFSSAIPIVLGLVAVCYWKRRQLPIVLLVSFSFYQTALLAAMMLHLLGHNFIRWSRGSTIE